MAELGALNTLRDGRSHLAVWMKVPVGTPDKIIIDTELVPILKLLIKGGSLTQTYHHKIRPLFIWLSDPQRSADEFIYVLGPLAKHVSHVMESDQSYSNEDSEYPINLVRIAAEAMAVLCPILEGSWEHAAWLMLSFTDSYSTKDKSFASDRLSTWIIHMIGDADMCPNPNLRTALMRLFVDIAKINDQNRALALRSVISACSVLNMEHEKSSLYNISPLHIYKLFSMLDKDEYLTDFDLNLIKNLENVRSSGLSDMLHDVSYTMRMNPNRYRDPIEIRGLTALLKTLAGYAQLVYRKVFLEGNSNSRRYEELALDILPTSVEIIYSFASSCQSFQMKEVTAEFIVDVFEMRLRFVPCAFRECEQILLMLFRENGFDTIDSSPLGQLILKNERRRVSEIGKRLDIFSLNHRYPMLYSLLYHDSIVEKEGDDEEFGGT